MSKGLAKLTKSEKTSYENLVIGNLYKIYYKQDEFSHIWAWRELKNDFVPLESFTMKAGSVVLILNKISESLVQKILFKNKILLLSKKDIIFKEFNI